MKTAESHDSTRTKLNLLKNDFTAIFYGNSFRAREIKLKCEAKANFHFQLLLCFLVYVRNIFELICWPISDTRFKVHFNSSQSIDSCFQIQILSLQHFITAPSKNVFFLFLFGHANEHKLQFNFIFLPAMFISISQDF